MMGTTVPMEGPPVDMYGNPMPMSGAQMPMQDPYGIALDVTVEIAPCPSIPDPHIIAKYKNTLRNSYEEVHVHCIAY